MMHVFVREKSNRQRRSLKAFWGLRSIEDAIKMATSYEYAEECEFEYLVYADPIEFYITGNCRRTRLYIDGVIFPEHIMSLIIDKPWLSLNELKKGSDKHVENNSFLTSESGT